MADRILIVARMAPDNAEKVAALFAASDGQSLPADLGVTRRELFRYQDDLYFHLVEFAGDADRAMAAARIREDFRQLCADLDPLIRPYDPVTWRSPADATATPFYRWTPEEGALRP
ncbi:cyclase [Streptomyces sp. Ncost-T6T-1]|uniref:TcmI family type II polyketide cyclase n=1 Tax=Streptomyces sp. Ncost-T6T-1 TaxID=1100828 RepID=UPI00080491F5|nr:TcmI family type II polyketide cyclase [Streptomyces sp. Ncost-T6T-1]SBV00236.1 cyclase [Streptomyces sp. Ncost-T6T-1]